MKHILIWLVLSISALCQNGGVPTIGFTGGASATGCGGQTGYAHHFTLTIPQQTGASTDLTSSAALYYAGVSNFAQTGSGGLSQTAGLNDLIFCTDGTSGASLISYIRVSSSYVSATGVVQLVIGPIPTVSHTTTTAIHGYIGKAADSDHSCGTACTGVIPSSIIILPMGSVGSFSMTDYAGHGTSPTNHGATGGSGSTPPFEYSTVTAGNWFDTGYSNNAITGSFTLAFWINNSDSGANRFVMGNIASSTFGVDIFITQGSCSGAGTSCLNYQIAKDNSNRTAQYVTTDIGHAGSTWHRFVISYTTGGGGKATICIDGTCTAPGSQNVQAGFPIGTPADPGSSTGTIQMFAPGAVASANWAGALDEVYWINGTAWSNDMALWDYNNQSQQTVGKATFTLIS